MANHPPPIPRSSIQPDPRAARPNGGASNDVAIPCGLPAFSRGKAVDHRLYSMVCDSDFERDLGAIVDVLPNAAIVSRLVLASLKRWILAVQSHVSWGHQIQQRLEFVLRCSLAVTLLQADGSSSTDLVVSSVLQLPLTSDGQQCVSVPHLLVGLADKPESVGGPCVVRESKAATNITPWILRHLLQPSSSSQETQSQTEDERPSFEGQVVRHLHTQLVAKLADIHQQQKLIPCPDVSSTSTDILLSLLECGHHATVQLAFVLANVLAQKYDATSPFYQTCMATWYSVCNRWIQGVQESATCLLACLDARPSHLRHAL